MAIGCRQSSQGVAFNLVGATDILVDYYHAIQTGLPTMPAQFGSTYAIPIIYVPLLMITHAVAFYFLLRPLFSKQGTAKQGTPLSQSQAKQQNGFA